MHNLRTVIWFELVRTLKKKTFWLSALAFPVIIAAVAGLSYVSNKTADEASEQLNKERFSFVVVDQSKLISPEIVRSAGGSLKSDVETAKESVVSGSLDAAFIYPSDPRTHEVQVYAQDDGIINNGKYSAAAEQLLKTSIAAGIGSPEKVTLLQGDVKQHLTTYENGAETKGFERAIAPGIFLVLFYALIVLLGNQMLTSTTEEKENRVIEMILTTVSATSLILGKIVTMLLLGFIQVAAIVAPLAVIYVFFRDSLHIPSFNFTELALDPERMAVGGLLFILSFLLFTGLLVAIGSAMPTAKEAGGFFGFTIVLMFAPLYAIGAIMSSPEQLMVQVFSFFPLTAPITLLLRNAVDNLSNIEVMAGVLVLALSSALALFLAVRTFKTGALRYDSKMSLAEVFGRAKGSSQ